MGVMKDYENEATYFVKKRDKTKSGFSDKTNAILENISQLYVPVVQVLNDLSERQAPPFRMIFLVEEDAAGEGMAYVHIGRISRDDANKFGCCMNINKLEYDVEGFKSTSFMASLLLLDNFPKRLRNKFVIQCYRGFVRDQVEITCEDLLAKVEEARGKLVSKRPGKNSQLGSCQTSQTLNLK